MLARAGIHKPFTGTAPQHGVLDRRALGHTLPFAGTPPAEPQTPAGGNPEDLYAPAFQQDLFDKMGRVYERVGDICSLGFSRIWRRRAVKALALKPGDKVCDLMAGTGESWKYFLPKIGPSGQVIAVDFSPEMCKIGQARVNKKGLTQVQVLQGDAMDTRLPANSMDSVYSAYGIKTLPKSDYPRLTAEVKRILKPGGRAAFVEVSMPDNKWHQKVFHVYLGVGFPLLKKLLGQRAKHFEMFNHYLTRFQNGRDLAQAFTQAGFSVQYKRLLGDGASLVIAEKPRDILETVQQAL